MLAERLRGVGRLRLEGISRYAVQVWKQIAVYCLNQGRICKRYNTPRLDDEVRNKVDDVEKIRRRARDKQTCTDLLTNRKEITVLRTIISCHVPKDCVRLMLTLWQTGVAFRSC